MTLYEYTQKKLEINYYEILHENRLSVLTVEMLMCHRRSDNQVLGN